MNSQLLTRTKFYVGNIRWCESHWTDIQNRTNNKQDDEEARNMKLFIKHKSKKRGYDSMLYIHYRIGWF